MTMLVAPALTYSLSDEMTLTAGAFISTGNATEAFSEDGSRGYVRWFVHF